MQQENCREKFGAITLRGERMKQWFFNAFALYLSRPQKQLVSFYCDFPSYHSIRQFHEVWFSFLLFYRYIHTSNLGLRLECCLLSATFFKVSEALSSLFPLVDFCLHFHDVFNSFQALFCSSLPHPTADKDYALYEVGAGCEVAELIPGIDLLSDAFRSNGRSVLAALRWITEELARARYLITVRELLRKKDFLKTGATMVLSQVVITLCFGARGLGSNSEPVTVGRGGGVVTCHQLPTYLEGVPIFLIIPSYSLQLL